MGHFPECCLNWFFEEEDDDEEEISGENQQRFLADRTLFPPYDALLPSFSAVCSALNILITAMYRLDHRSWSLHQLQFAAPLWNNCFYIKNYSIVCVEANSELWRPHAVRSGAITRMNMLV